jgi:hypothetical protein
VSRGGDATGSLAVASSGSRGAAQIPSCSGSGRGEGGGRRSAFFPFSFLWVVAEPVDPNLTVSPVSIGRLLTRGIGGFDPRGDAQRFPILIMSLFYLLLLTSVNCFKKL